MTGEFKLIDLLIDCATAMVMAKPENMTITVITIDNLEALVTSLVNVAPVYISSNSKAYVISFVSKSVSIRRP